MKDTTLAATVVATVCRGGCSDAGHVQQTSLNPFNLDGIVDMSETETSVMWPLEEDGARDKEGMRVFVASLVLRHEILDPVQACTLNPEP